MRASAAFATMMLLQFFCSAAQATGYGRVFDEVRFGLSQHDTGVVGDRKEKGSDISLEILSRPILISRIFGAPRIVLGGALNSAGQTDQVYIGLLRDWQLFQDVLQPGDAIFFEGVLGGAWNDGKIDVRGTPLESSWKSHGSHFLFREGLGIGYRMSPSWSVAITFAHISNAGLAIPNEGMNNLGFVIGRKL